MSKEHLQEIIDAVEEEGIDYAFNNLSGWTNIEDEEFHRLRKEYCRAGNALRAYLGLWPADKVDDILGSE